MAGRPNFLLIVVDDMGFSDIGAFGSEIETPNLDALAYAGLRLTDFHSAPACSPTRAMLMTGTDHHIAGIGAMLETVRRDFKGAPGYEGYLNERVVTVAELLRDAGYLTAMTGKWHLGDNTLATGPQARGFTRSFALLPGAGEHFAAGAMIQMTGGQPVYAEDGAFVRDLPADFYSSDAFTDRLIDFIDTGPNDQPFFAYLAFSAPHWPLQAPAAVIDKYRGRYDAGPNVLRDQRLARLKGLGLFRENVVAHPIVADTPDWDEMSAEGRAYSARTMEVYAAMVDRIDWNVGRLVAHLKARGMLDDTAIVFLSDNGAEGSIVEAMPIIGPVFAKLIAERCDNSLDNIGKPGSLVWYGPRWAQAASAPLRLMKTFTTEGGIRVPAFVRWPGAARQGEIGTGFSTAMDVAPTLLELAGAEHPGSRYRGRDIVGMRGRSLVDYLRGEADQIHPDGTVTGWELFGRKAVRQDDWKAVYVPDLQGRSAWQLYDLGDDVGEVRDLAREQPEKFAEMLELWAAWRDETGVIEEPLSFYELDAAVFAATARAKG